MTDGPALEETTDSWRLLLKLMVAGLMPGLCLGVLGLFVWLTPHGWLDNLFMGVFMVAVGMGPIIVLICLYPCIICILGAIFQRDARFFLPFFAWGMSVFSYSLVPYMLFNSLFGHLAS